MGKSGRISRQLFGMVAMSMGMVTQDQLDKCLEVQQKSKKRRQIGEIMLVHGDLSRKQVKEVLAVQKRMGDAACLPIDKTETRALIGEIMVEAAYINVQTLENALGRQELLRMTGISPRIGELLIAVGRLTRNQLEKALAAQAMFPVTSNDEMRGVGDENELADLAADDFAGIWSGLMVRLLSIDEYRGLFANAFPDIAEADLTFAHAANALAAFEIDHWSLTDSPFDRYLGGDDSALADSAKRGGLLFYGEAG